VTSNSISDELKQQRSGLPFAKSLLELYKKNLRKATNQVIKNLLLLTSLFFISKAQAFELTLSLDSVEISTGRIWIIYGDDYFTLTENELDVTLNCNGQTLTVGKISIPFISPDQDTCLQKIENLNSFFSRRLVSVVTFSTSQDENGMTILKIDSK